MTQKLKDQKPSSAAGELPGAPIGRQVSVGIVVIGRNEGERLIACLASLPALPTVYVDSGSTDGSVAAAEAAGAEIVSLDMDLPFSAARARNEGAERLLTFAPDLEAIQFLDGDTTLRPGWLDAACAFLTTHPRAVAVAGRRRERTPDASWYDTLCDVEWDTPVGEAGAVGGDALYRVSAFTAAGGFDPQMMAGEEPELCLRLRRAGGTVHRLDEEMTLHDAAIRRFGAWWKRAARGGYAAMLGVLKHGRSGYEVRPVARSLLWGGLLPLAAVSSLAFGVLWAAAAIGVIYALKWLKLRRRFGHRVEQPGRYALFLMLSNVAEIGGITRCLAESVRGRRQIVEYK